MNGHGLSQSEQRDLLKVFGDLADFAPKQKLRRELEPKVARRRKIALFMNNPEAVKLVDETGAELPVEVVVVEDKRLETEEKALQRLIDEVDSKPLDSKRIHHRDLLQALESLGKATNKKEVEDMVWEVDEDSDGTVSWKEFYLMYVRNQSDDTGLEPSQLFSVVQFLMYDKQNKGEVTLDQTMEMLFKKYGKDKLEAEIKVSLLEGVGWGGQGG